MAQITSIAAYPLNISANKYSEYIIADTKKITGLELAKVCQHYEAEIRYLLLQQKEILGYQYNNKETTTF